MPHVSPPPGLFCRFMVDSKLPFCCCHSSVKCANPASPILSSAPLKSVNSWLELRTQLRGRLIVCCLSVQLGTLTGREAGGLRGPPAEGGGCWLSLPAETLLVCMQPLPGGQLWGSWGSLKVQLRWSELSLALKVMSDKVALEALCEK